MRTGSADRVWTRDGCLPPSLSHCWGWRGGLWGRGWRCWGGGEGSSTPNLQHGCVGWPRWVQCDGCELDGQWDIPLKAQSFLQHIVPWPCKAEQGMTTPVFCRPALNSFPTSHPFCPPGSRFLPVFLVRAREERGPAESSRLNECSPHLWECRRDLTDLLELSAPHALNLGEPSKTDPTEPPKHNSRISRRRESDSDIAATRVTVSVSSPPSRAGLSNADGFLSVSAHRPARRRFEIRVPPDYHRAPARLDAVPYP